MLTKKTLITAALMLTGSLSLSSCGLIEIINEDKAAAESNSSSEQAPNASATNPVISTQQGTAHDHGREKIQAEAPPELADLSAQTPYLLSEDMDIRYNMGTGSVTISNFPLQDEPQTNEFSTAKHIKIYQDMQCLQCQDLSQSVSASTKKLLEGDQDVVVEYVTVNTFNSPWSVAASNALVSVADDEETERYFLAVQDALFSSVPNLGISAQEAETQVIDRASTVMTPEGIESVTECVTGESHTEEINDYTAVIARDESVSAVPTVVIDGKRYDNYKKAAEVVNAMVR